MSRIAFGFSLQCVSFVGVYHSRPVALERSSYRCIWRRVAALVPTDVNGRLIARRCWKNATRKTENAIEIKIIQFSLLKHRSECHIRAEYRSAGAENRNEEKRQENIHDIE